MWNSTDDHIVITHINQEDDEGSLPRESKLESRYRMKERIFGRNVDQNIHSISPPEHGEFSTEFWTLEHIILSVSFELLTKITRSKICSIFKKPHFIDFVIWISNCSIYSR